MKAFATKFTGSTLFAATFVHTVLADNLVDKGAGDAQPTGTPDNLFSGKNAIFKSISNTLIFLVGAVAVIMIIIGGLRYVLSQGDANNVKAAKDTILYGVIGVIVAIMAYALVHFVAKSVS